jgi:hypothetical protein
MASLSLAEAFALIPDPRDRRGRQHPLVAMLCLATVAVLAGCRSINAVAQFGRDHGLPMAHALGFNKARTPAPSTFSELFRELDVAAVERALRAWLLARGAGAGEHLALDGKTARGSAAGDVPGVHLLAAFATADAAVLGQLEVARTTNEHKAALCLLGVLPLAGKVVTADAMFAHADVCDTITDAGADYVLAVKGNQEQLHQDIQVLFEGDGTSFSPLPATTVARGPSERHDDRQGARPGRDAHGHDQYMAQRVSQGVAPVGAGRARGTGTPDPRRDDRGGELLHHEFGSPPCQRGASG